MAEYQLREAAAAHEGPVRWIFLRSGKKTYPPPPGTRGILDSLTGKAAPERRQSIDILELHAVQPVRGFDPPASELLDDDSTILMLPGAGRGTPFHDGAYLLKKAEAARIDAMNLVRAENITPLKSGRIGWSRRAFALPVRRPAAEIAAVECTLQVSGKPSRRKNLSAELRWTSEENGISGSIAVPVTSETGSVRIEFSTGSCPGFALTAGDSPELELVLHKTCEIKNDSVLILSPGLAGMVRIPAGTLLSGDAPADGDKFGGETIQEVRRVESFWIDRFEYPGRRWAIPAVNVDWYEAVAGCKGMGKRLCTEWEWERACRGPGNLDYPYGRRFSRTACFTDRRFNNYTPQPAGSFPACVSPYGVYDMSGNVNEWTSSALSLAEVRAMGGHASYGIYDSGSDPPDAVYPILRGGDWGEGSNDTRCANRDHYHPPGSRLEDDGFRCCRDAAGSVLEPAQR